MQKSIKQQYIDLQEGNMSQANFMRNLRMTMPQYITNVISFDDSIKILRNKGILTEADEKGRWTNADGKSMYDQFKEIDNLNGQEVLIGIDYEMEKNEELTKIAATKIVLKNLKKNPIYYTSTLMSGKEGYEPEYIGGKSAQPEAHQMQYLDKNMSNVVDKKRGMQLVKNVEKVKKDADAKKETNKVESGVSLMSLVAKATRGVQKMDATGEKMKKVAMKEAKEEKPSVPHTIFSKNQKISDYLKKLQDDNESTSKNIDDKSTSKNTSDKSTLTKESLLQMIHEELREITGAYGGDAMSGEDGSSYIKEEAGVIEYTDKEKWIKDLYATFPNKLKPEDFGENKESNSIRVSNNYQSFGFWNSNTGKGKIYLNAITPSDVIYPPGSRMD